MELIDYRDQLILRGFDAVIDPTIEEARKRIIDLISDGSSVGIGGSVSIEQSGIYEKLLEKNCTIYWHSKCSTPAEGETARKKTIGADIFLCSVNAITKDGSIINVDGKGNRIAAIAYGPGTVIFLVGKNKLVDGGVEEAFTYIHNVICPKNTKRLGLNLPCGRQESCNDCASPQRMCNLNLIIDHVPRDRKYIVVLVEQELGH